MRGKLMTQPMKPKNPNTRNHTPKAGPNSKGYKRGDKTASSPMVNSNDGRRSHIGSNDGSGSVRVYSSTAAQDDARRQRRERDERLRTTPIEEVILDEIDTSLNKRAAKEGWSDQRLNTARRYADNLVCGPVDDQTGAGMHPGSRSIVNHLFAGSCEFHERRLRFENRTLPGMQLDWFSPKFDQIKSARAQRRAAKYQSMVGSAS